MRTTRLFCPVPSDEFVLPEEARHHLETVLRLRAGARFTALDQGHEHECELLAPGRARVLARRPGAREASVRIRLYLALNKRFDEAVEMAAELGAHSIIPVRCERSGPGEARLDRWRRIACSGAALAGRSLAPSVGAPQGFMEALSTAPSAILFAPEGKRLEGLSAREVSLFIGPEGGFSEQEVEGARRQGAVLASLGARILRVETAAAAAVTLALRVAGEI